MHKAMQLLCVTTDRKPTTGRAKARKEKKKRKNSLIFILQVWKSEVNWAHDGRDHRQVGQYKLQAAQHSSVRAIESSIMLLPYDIGVP